MIFKILIFFLLFFTQNNVGRNFQNRIFTIGARGIVVCNGRPFKNAQIVLSHHYRWKGKNPKIFGADITSDFGRFRVSGRMQTFIAMPPFVAIIHKCNERKSGCRKITNIQLASASLFKSRNCVKGFDLGLIDLSKLPVQKTVCDRRE